MKRTLKLVKSAVCCALLFAATWISVPAPSIGNINLGDSVLILCARILGGAWAVVSCAAGAALADLTSGYAIYAPATCAIKALMAAVFLRVQKLCEKNGALRKRSLFLGGCLAEALMIAGYFLYESIALGYGWGAAVNLPFNAIQGAVNLVLSCSIYAFLSKSGALDRL